MVMEATLMISSIAAIDTKNRSMPLNSRSRLYQGAVFLAEEAFELGS